MGAFVPIVVAAIMVGIMAVLYYRLNSEHQALVERKRNDDVQTRHEIEALRRRNGHILDHLPVGIVVIEAATRRIVSMNPHARSLLGSVHPDNLELRNEEGEIHSKETHPFGSKVAPAEDVEVLLARENGPDLHLRVSSIFAETPHGPLDVVYAVRDDTEQVEAEDALARSHRLEAFGTLTSGIVHDLNNLLTPMVGAFDLVARDGGASAVAVRACERGRQAATMMQAMIARLRSFAQNSDHEIRPVKAKDLVDATYELFGRKLGPGISTYVRRDADPTVSVDPAQFELAMLNLMTNARDAMPSGGDLSITIDEESLANPDGGSAVPHARITFTDHGSGMDEETLSKATDPFFTTKEIGKASGLGLAMVDAFVSDSGGRLRIESSLGNGTRVDMWLPTTDRSPDERTADTGLQAKPMRILLVDDDELVRDATADMLRDMGHDVVCASSGAEGIAIMRRDGAVEAVVSDHLMPEMTGGTMSHHIWDFLPDMKILLISGYAKTRGLPKDVPHLAKPFRSAELSQALADLMES